MDEARDRLHAALASVLAKREHLKQVRGQLGERVGQQLDTMAGAEQVVSESQMENPNILAHRRHVGLLDERSRLERLHAHLDGVGDDE